MFRATKTAIAAACVFVLGTASANAVLLNYDFDIFVGEYSYRDSSGTLIVNSSGEHITVSGMTTSDIDIQPSGGLGFYTTMATFGLGGGLQFETDATSDIIYAQRDDGSEIILVGLTSSSGAQGFSTAVAPGDQPIGDADLGGVPIGINLIPFSPGSSPTWFLQNAAGEELFLNFSAQPVNSTALPPVLEYSVTAKAVSEPAVLAVFALGLVGLGVAARRRTKARS